MEIVLATRNRDKIAEIRSIMVPIDVVLAADDRFPDLPDVVEDGDTLEHNALKKAREVRDFTGMCALADDTGLEVDALDGAPGVYSSRYAGEDATYEDNCQKLLEDMRGVAAGERGARFRSVMALALTDDVASAVASRAAEIGVDTADDDGVPDALVTEGVIEGTITKDARGSGGFGYDPVFEVHDLGKTLAELGEEKNRMSHRYRALVELRELLLRLELASERSVS